MQLFPPTQLFCGDSWPCRNGYAHRYIIRQRVHARVPFCASIMTTPSRAFARVTYGTQTTIGLTMSLSGENIPLPRNEPRYSFLRIAKHCQKNTPRQNGGTLLDLSCFPRNLWQRLCTRTVIPGGLNSFVNSVKKKS